MCNSGVLGPNFIPSKNKLDILTTFWDGKMKATTQTFFPKQMFNQKMWNCWHFYIYKYINIYSYLFRKAIVFKKKCIHIIYLYIYGTHILQFPTNPKKKINLRSPITSCFTATSLPKGSPMSVVPTSGIKVPRMPPIHLPCTIDFPQHWPVWLKYWDVFTGS